MVSIYILCVSLQGVTQYPYYRVEFIPECKAYEILHDVEQVLIPIEEGYKIDNEFITLKTGEKLSANALKDSMSKKLPAKHQRRELEDGIKD